MSDYLNELEASLPAIDGIKVEKVVLKDKIFRLDSGTEMYCVEVQPIYEQQHPALDLNVFAKIPVLDHQFLKIDLFTDDPRVVDVVRELEAIMAEQSGAPFSPGTNAKLKVGEMTFDFNTVCLSEYSSADRSDAGGFLPKLDRLRINFYGWTQS